MPTTNAAAASADRHGRERCDAPRSCARRRARRGSRPARAGRGARERRSRRARARTRRGTPRSCRRSLVRHCAHAALAYARGARGRAPGRGLDRRAGSRSSVARSRFHSSQPHGVSGTRRTVAAPSPSGDRLGSNRPPDHRGQVDDRDLQDDEHEDRFPDGDVHRRQSNAHRRTRAPDAAFLTQALTLRVARVPGGSSQPPLPPTRRPQETLVRRTVRLVTRSVRARGARRARGDGDAAGHGSGAHVGRLPRRPELPLGRRPARAHRSARRRRTPTIMRLLVQWNLAAPRRARRTRPTRSTRRTVSTTSTRPCAPRRTTTRRSSSRSRERRSGRTAARPRTVMPNERRRLHGLRARDRVAVLRPLRRATRSSASGRSGTSRTSSGSSRRSSTAAAARSRPRTTRSSYAAAYAGIKAGNPQAQVAIGETSARGSDKPNGAPADALARQVRRARREGEPAASSSTPGRTTRIRSNPNSPADARS